MEKLRRWWSFNEAEETASVDNPFEPLRDSQRQNTLPMLVLAFGWGFLVTGLLTGGALGQGVPFWPELIGAAAVGNFVNFVIGALIGYMGYRTGCNSALLYRYVYGRIGVVLPVLFIALLTIGWQAIIVGAFGFAWAQSFETPLFYGVAIAGGLLFTATTYFGVKGIEKVALPSVLVLLLVGLYAGWSNIAQAGGWNAFLAESTALAAREPISFGAAVNLVIGSWIVGAVVMPEYTRFAKRGWVAVAIPFIVLIISQWFLQIVGALGAVVAGTPDFTTYMLAQGMVVGGVGLVGMSLALWTTGDANLYLPAIQTASVLRRPKRVMVVLCGVIGTVLGLGLYQYFENWIAILAALVPPLIGPALVDYYIVHRGRYDAQDLHRLHAWNPAAVAAYLLGALSTFFPLSWLVPSLQGLLVSMLAYGVAVALAQALGYAPGYRRGAAGAASGALAGTGP